MVNCNPETVSTDYDISDRLYFEPLTFEDVANICANEPPQGRDRAVRRPDAAAHRPRARGGRHPHPGHAARTRSTWPRTAAGSATLLDELGISCPTYGVARARDEALAIGERIGYPCLVRPSYVLGGRAMEIVYSSAELGRYVDTAVQREPATSRSSSTSS